MAQWSEFLLITAWNPNVALQLRKKKKHCINSSKAFKNDKNAQDFWPLVNLAYITPS